MTHSKFRKSIGLAMFFGVFLASASVTLGGSLFGPGLSWVPTNFVPSEIKVIAVVVDYPPVQHKANVGYMLKMASSVQQEFEQALQTKGYTLVARTKLSECQKELDLRRLKITDREGAAHAGRVLNTSHLLIVSAVVNLTSSVQKDFLTGKPEKVQELSVRLNCQILVTETGLQVAACSDDTTTQGKGLAELDSTAVRVAKRIAKVLPARQTATDSVSKGSR
jgi:hypothetical protein